MATELSFGLTGEGAWREYFQPQKGAPNKVNPDRKHSANVLGFERFSHQLPTDREERGELFTPRAMARLLGGE